MIGSNVNPQEKISKVKAIYDKLNLGLRCQGLMQKYAQEAVDALKTLGLSDGDLDFFYQMSQNAISRIH